MDLCMDFLDYNTNVYGHVVRIIGWGVQNGTDFWLIANSWGLGWGDEKDRGVFKMIRGINDCNIEKWVIGPIPKVDKPPSHNNNIDIWMDN